RARTGAGEVRVEGDHQLHRVVVERTAADVAAHATGEVDGRRRAAQGDRSGEVDPVERALLSSEIGCELLGAIELGNGAQVGLPAVPQVQRRRADDRRDRGRVELHL